MTKCMRFIILLTVLSILTTPVFCREIKAEQIQATMEENSKDEESTESKDKKTNDNVKDTESDDNKDNKENVKDTESDDKDNKENSKNTENENDNKNKYVYILNMGSPYRKWQGATLYARFTADENYDGLIDVPIFTISGPNNYICTVDSSVEHIKDEHLDMYCWWTDRDFVEFEILYAEKGEWRFEASAPCTYEVPCYTETQNEFENNL